MKRGSSSLASAISDLRREAEAGLRDNVYYLTAQKLNELSEIINGRNGAEPPAADGASQRLIGFGPALEALRAKLDTELKDNRYYLASHKLDVIALIAARAKAAKAQSTSVTPKPESAASIHAALDSASAAPKPRSFDDLAVESHRRVEEVIRLAGEASYDYERRSSEPCSAAEFESMAGAAGVPQPTPTPPATAIASAPKAPEQAAAILSPGDALVEAKKGLFSSFVRTIRGG